MSLHAALLALDPSSFRRRPEPPPITPIKYGFLYNWWATQEQSVGVWLVSDAMRALNWGMPSDADFKELELHLGISSADVELEDWRGTDEGGKLKEDGLTWWNSPNTAATNEVGFNAKGAGRREEIGGLFSSLKNLVNFWTNTITGSYAYRRTLGYENGGIFRQPYQKGRGLSIRLFRPATAAEQLLPDGKLIGVFYYGNDGKVYRVTKIGTQVWIADNLAETKWSDGSWIQGYDGGTYTPITDANWAALTTAALCAYDDDETNV